MTIAEAIARIDEMKPNSYAQTDKIVWLSELDGRIKNDIIDTHEGAESVSYSGYDITTPLSTELIVPAPYDKVYLSWLESRMDYANGEYTRYNNSSVMFNEDYEAFASYYNRTHMPKGKKMRFF